MASSQLEIVSSSSPFGCVLRDHKRKERCRKSNVRAVQAVFDNNFSDLVRDHINGSISLSSAQNLENQITHVASLVTNEQANGKHPHKLRNLNKNHHHNMKSEQPSPINPRHSPILDRWVTRQAQDVTVSTINKLANEAAEPLLTPSHSNTSSLTTSMTSSSKTKNAQNFSSQIDNASIKNNHGASSLVQIWEARLNRSNSMNSNQNQSQSMGSNASRTSSGLSSNENNTSIVEEPSKADPLDEKFDDRTNNGDSLIDWESRSDRTVAGEIASSSCSRSFDTGEIERVRIADIIKRLKNGRVDADNHNVTQSQCGGHKHCSTSDQAEQRCFPQVTNSPRLRGRQAFNDLRTQIERDKNRELDSLAKRQAVSKFSQRGRLQSMLRLKCLQRCVTIQDKCHPQSPGANVNRLPQGSTIMHLREKFSTGAEHLMTAQNVSATPSPRCLHREVINNSIPLDKSCTCKLPQSEDGHCQNLSSAGQQSTWPVNRLAMNKNEDLHAEANPSLDAIQQKTRCLETLKIANATTPLEGQSENGMAKKLGSNSQQHHLLDSQEAVEKISSLNVNTQNEIAHENHHNHLALDLQEIIETTTSLNSSTENEIAEEQDIGDHRQHLCLDSQEILENSTSYNDRNENEVTEEVEDHYQQYFAPTNYDWFSNISRPRSYWEGLRKAWYQEVLNTTSKNEEIRQLLERGRVSTLLGSDFRERMDRLMIFRVQMQADGTESQQEVDGKERMVQAMSHLRRHLHPADDQEEEEEEEEEERSLSSHQCHESNNYFNQSSSSLQMPSPSDLMRSWSFQDDNETGNDSDRGASAISSPPGPSQAQCYQDNRQSSSLEMELICDLRGHMEQLHHEIGELRKSILSCMDMQMKLQHYSFNREVHSVEGEGEGEGKGKGKGRDSADRTPWKRNCCICYEMLVDSLLYRCGHLCTCLKCGHELQWRSGKCPICGAPILDVVPAK